MTMKITIATAILAMSTLFAQSTTTPTTPAPGKMEKSKTGKHKKSHKKMATTPAPAVK